MLFLPLVALGSLLELTGDASKIRMNKATLVASCSSSEEPSIAHLQYPDNSTSKDITGFLHNWDKTLGTIDPLRVTLFLEGVHSTCSGQSAHTPCMSLVPSWAALFYWCAGRHVTV